MSYCNVWVEVVFRPKVWCLLLIPCTSPNSISLQSFKCVCSEFNQRKKMNNSTPFPLSNRTHFLTRSSFWWCGRIDVKLTANFVCTHLMLDHHCHPFILSITVIDWKKKHIFPVQCVLLYVPGFQMELLIWLESSTLVVHQSYNLIWCPVLTACSAKAEAPLKICTPSNSTCPPCLPNVWLGHGIL